MNNQEKRFCKGCGQRLPAPSIFDIVNKNKAKVHEFEDGFYCDGCAKSKVDKARKKGKGK